MHQSVVIDVIEGDLLPMHVQAAYHGHRDLLELLKHFSDAHIIERLRRGGPHHMSSLDARWWSPVSTAPAVETHRSAS